MKLPSTDWPALIVKHERPLIPEHRTMRLTLILLLIVTFIAPAFNQAAAQTMAAMDISFKVGEAERRAILVNEAPAGEIRPVVIVLHGGNGSAETQRLRTGFDDVARSEGFTVVYAEGTQWAPRQHAWNTGYLLRKQVGGADDIAYLDKLIDLLISQHRADPARIYMTGGSNGAMMTLVYATQRPQRLAAVAPIVGAMFSFDSRPIVPLPILFINGGLDNEVPIEGGLSRNELVSRNQAAAYKSLEETVSFWVAANGSKSVPVVEQLGTVTTRVFSAGPAGAETVVVVDSAGGHGWPGSKSNRQENTPIQAFKGADRVWTFFKDKQRVPVPSHSVIGANESKGMSVPHNAMPVASKIPSEQSNRARASAPGIDANQDGMISRAEWLAAGFREQGFAIMDSDRNGNLSPQELKQGRTRLEDRRTQPVGKGSN